MNTFGGELKTYEVQPNPAALTAHRISLHEVFVALGFSQPIELRVAELISGVRSDVAVKLFGDDLDVLRREANEIARAISAVPGAQDVKVEQVSGLPITTAKIDREAIARHGATADEVLSVIEALGGRQVGVR